MVMTPKDIQMVLSLSRNTVYELLHSKDFPAFQIGNQYRISRDRFAEWLATTKGVEIKWKK